MIGGSNKWKSSEQISMKNQHFFTTKPTQISKQDG